ncbi:MAG: hypothetical protein DRP18_03200 [Candidatus Aenigmatarchaeota archaeon]|nr:MAG: hypothetical protein DRP18_03200 [Candidatus Aenigmarchaeota archaeon]
MICSECEETIEKCDWCGEKFEKDMDVICYDTGISYLHFCCKECLYEYIEYYTTSATAIERRNHA